MQTEQTTSATGDDASVCLRQRIERKNSIDEFISCMITGRDRFERELKRMGSYESAIIFFFRSERALSSFKKLDF